MEPRRPPEYIIEVFADPTSVKDVVRGQYSASSAQTGLLTIGPTGILHTIFFHRFFPSIRPKTRDVLDITLPVVEDVELETLIDQRTAALVRQLDSSSDMGSRGSGVRALLAVQFFEKKRRKAWFTKGEEEVCWEQWTLDVTLATPRTESRLYSYSCSDADLTDLMFTRACESSKGHGSHAAEGCDEDCDHSKPRKRSHSPNHN